MTGNPCSALVHICNRYIDLIYSCPNPISLSGANPTFGIRITYGDLLAAAHGDPWSGIDDYSFTLHANDIIHTVSVWRAPNSGIAGVSEEYEGNVKGLAFDVRRGIHSRRFGPYGSTEGNLTSLYVGRLEYISGFSGDIDQAPLQLKFHFLCTEASCT